MIYFIEGGERCFDELPESITVKEAGWYGHLKDTGRRLPEYRYVRDAEPVYVVRVNGCLRSDDAERLRDRAQAALGGKVVVVDGMVEDVYELGVQDVSWLVEVLAPAVGFEVRKVDE